MLFEQGGDAFGVYVRQQSQRKVGLTADLFAELRSQLRGRARIEIGLDLFGRRPAPLEEGLQPLDVAAVKIHKTRVVQGRTQELPRQRYSPSSPALAVPSSEALPPLIPWTALTDS